MRTGHRRGHWLAMLVLATSAVFCVFGLRSTSRWWYEDDPLQFAAAAASSPIDIFTDPSVLRHFGTGASLVPMQVLSYWIDGQMFGASPKAAHVHSLVSTLVAALLLYLVLARSTGAPAVSALVALAWVALPSTIAVHSYLSTRHYVEATAWGLAASLLLQRTATQPPGKVRAAQVLLLLGFAAAAMLSKEIWVLVLTAFIVLYALAHRRHALATAAAGLALSYGAYRHAMLGPGLRYPVSRVDAGDYVRYLADLPYTFSAGPAGYLFYACLLGGAVWAVWRDPRGASRAVFLLMCLFVAALLATYPTAAAVLATHRCPGTWYRAVFPMNTVTLAAAGYLVGRYGGRRVQSAALCLLFAIVMQGARVTRAYWDRRFERAEAEGRYYVSHPNRLVYSEEDASWFLPGLERLYAVPASHFVSKNELAGDQARQMIRSFPTIFRFSESGWIEDRELYARIREANRAP